MPHLALAAILAALSLSVDATPDPEYRAQVGVCFLAMTPTGPSRMCRMVEDTRGPYRSEGACQERLREMVGRLDERLAHTQPRFIPRCTSNVVGLPI